MLWKNTDQAANSPVWAVNYVNQGISSNNSNSLFSNTTASVIKTNVTVGLFGVDSNEMRAARASGNPKPAHSGWVMRTVGTGGRAGRVQQEVLVAMNTIGTDYEDVAYPNVAFVITGQPQSNVIGRGNAVNFVVSADSVPDGYTINYYWQQDGGNAVLTWANVQNSGAFASANGNTSSTLSVSNNYLVTGNTFRAVLWNANGFTKMSSNASISYT